MPTIDTLVSDIYALTNKGESKSGEHVVSVSYDKWFEERAPRKPKSLYFSEIGTKCPRKLWYNVNLPTAAETLEPATKVKFLYGDMLEDLVLSLAVAAGHKVEYRQESLVYEAGDGWQVRGRIDAVIDGVMVDVKSTTKFGQVKFEEGLKDDPFGYYQQLNGYATVANTPGSGFLTIQKELGHINFYPFPVDPRSFFEQVDHVIEAVTTPIDKLDRFAPVPQSPTSKNMKLSTACSYCAYKKECFPLVRTFLYSNGPVYLTTVVDTPKVMEIL